MAQAPLSACGFLVFDTGKLVMQKVTKNSQLSDRETTVARFVSVLVCSLLLTPGERIKCLIQVSTVLLNCYIFCLYLYLFVVMQLI